MLLVWGQGIHQKKLSPQFPLSHLTAFVCHKVSKRVLGISNQFCSFRYFEKLWQHYIVCQISDDFWRKLIFRQILPIWIFWKTLIGLHVTLNFSPLCFWLNYFLIRMKKKWKFRKNYRPISIHHTCPGGIYWLLLLIFKFCHRVNMSCMYKRLALLHILVYFLITYIRRNRLYPTKALGVTSSIWFCSKRLKEKNGKSLFLNVRLWHLLIICWW